MGRLVTDDHCDETLAGIDELLTPCGTGGFAENQQPQGRGLADSVRISCGSEKIPLPEPAKNLEYPLEALGDLLGGAAIRLAYHVQAPKGIAGQSVLAAAALIAQGHINVSRGGIGTGPVSLFCLTVAGSGDRKSSLDKLALKPVREFERQRREEYKQHKAEYQAAMDAWQLRRDSIIKAATPKGSKAPLPEPQQKQLEADLSEVEATRPAPPDAPNMTFEEPTAEGVWRHFQHGLGSAGLFSDEGVAFFNGHGMTAEAKGRSIATLSGLWDGKPITRTRAAEGESGVMAGRRLSAHLMVQPNIAAEVLADPMLLGQGFLARFLVCREPSIAGTRLLGDRPAGENPNQDPAIIAYWECLERLLQRPLEFDPQSGELRLEALPIEGRAFEAWRDWHDGIERELGKDGGYTDIQAFASKAAENLARIAGVLAWVESSPITPEHIDRAGELTQYYLAGMAAQTRYAQEDKNAIDAAELLRWIQENGGVIRARSFNALPTKFRKATEARKLLGLLVHMGHIKVTEEGASGKPSAWEVAADDQS